MGSGSVSAQSLKGLLAGSGALFVVGVLMATLSYAATMFWSRSEIARGTIMGVEEIPLRGYTLYKPTVQFRDSSGSHREVSGLVGDGTAEQRIGGKVFVVYRRANPDQAKLGEFDKVYRVPIAGCALAGIGLIGMLLTRGWGALDRLGRALGPRLANARFVGAYSVAVSVLYVCEDLMSPGHFASAAIFTYFSGLIFGKILGRLIFGVAHYAPGLLSVIRNMALLVFLLAQSPVLSLEHGVVLFPFPGSGLFLGVLWAAWCADSAE